MNINLVKKLLNANTQTSDMLEHKKQKKNTTNLIY